jgi:hypothetical protein
MGKKMCPKVILEGTRLTLKTELAFTLNEHPRIVASTASTSPPERISCGTAAATTISPGSRISFARSGFASRS